MKSKTIDLFFKKKSTETTQSPSKASQIEVPHSSLALLNSDARPSKILRVEDEALDLSNIEREPRLHKKIYEYPVNVHHAIRRAYIKAGPLSLDRKTTQQIAANRLRLKTSIDVVRWLSFQGCAFRGHDESSGSKNRGNFLELLSLLASYDKKVEDVLKSAPQNATYTSSTIQKEILQVYVSRVCNIIREEIVHVKDIASLTLKNVIFNVLLQHSYDGASDMRGEFNGLQALILNDCRYTYYVYLAKEVVEVHQFFKQFSDIVNILATGIGMNQIGTLQHPGETRWGSHLNSVTSLLKMYNATSTVLENLKNTSSNYSQSFEFIFILHMMKEVLGITDNLCQALQRRSQDILNAMSLVLRMKDLKNVISFCETWELDFPNMNAQYIVGRSRNKKEDVTVEYHYRMDIFFATIDTQLQELKSKFNENVVKLLTLSIALDPKEFFKLFTIDKICILKESPPYELKHYELDVFESKKLVMYPFVDRLIRLILILPVSIASSECTFSAMKIVKTQLRSKMEDDFLKSSSVVYIEKEIAKKFDINKIIYDFSEVKDRRVQFKYIIRFLSS
ncbi:hypothetical protein V6Z11_A08G139600 [Gossypium hirsutum]